MALTSSLGAPGGIWPGYPANDLSATAGSTAPSRLPARSAGLRCAARQQRQRDGDARSNDDDRRRHCQSQTTAFNPCTCHHGCSSRGYASLSPGRVRRWHRARRLRTDPSRTSNRVPPETPAALRRTYLALRDSVKRHPHRESRQPASSTETWLRRGLRTGKNASQGRAARIARHMSSRRSGPGRPGSAGPRPARITPPDCQTPAVK